MSQEKISKIRAGNIETNSKIFLTKVEKLLIALGVVLLFASFFYDDTILKFAGSIRIYPLDAFMLFMTDFGLLYCVILLAAYLLVRKKYQEIVLIGLTGAFAVEVSYLLKVIFQTPRPFAAAVVATIPLLQASGFSMPSLHTAFCFSVWPYMHHIFHKKIYLMFGYAIILIIATSRLYLGVHYLSDIIAGGLIGLLLAKGWLYAEEKHKILEWFIYHVKDKFELRRQVLHLLIGCSIVFLLKLQLLNENILFIVLVLGGITSLTIRKYRIPVIDKLLAYFERPKELQYFPGKGSFFLVLGSLLTLLLFKRDIALAAISIMAVGDSITTIIGTYFGKIKNPLNPKKHLEGTALAIIASTLAAFFFVDFEKAFAAGFVGMVVESLTIPFVSKVLDDNLMIPLVAGVVMTWMGG